MGQREIMMEIIRYSKLNNIENIIHQNLWEAAKPILEEIYSLECLH